MNEENVTRFLKYLSPDANEADHLYHLLHKKLSDFFRFRGISDPADAADEAIDRAVEKLAGDAVVPDVWKFCFGIARNIALERLRQDIAKDRQK